MVVPDFPAGWADELLRARGRHQLTGCYFIEIPRLVAYMALHFQQIAGPWRP